jgi:tetratricopeptide (TPR) repeat protein
LYNQNRLQEAQDAFQIAYLDNPYNFHVINNLATSYLQQKEFEIAIELYREVLEINWKFADGRYNLAYCYVAQGKYELARQEIIRIPREAEKRETYIQLISQMIAAAKNQK